MSLKAVPRAPLMNLGEFSAPYCLASSMASSMMTLEGFLFSMSSYMASLRIARSTRLSFSNGHSGAACWMRASMRLLWATTC